MVVSAQPREQAELFTQPCTEVEGCSAESSQTEVILECMYLHVPVVLDLTKGAYKGFNVGHRK